MTTNCTLFILTLPNDASGSFSSKLKVYLNENINDKPIWTTSTDKQSLQITFHTELGAVSEKILRDLNKLEISKQNGCRICVLPATIIDGFQNPNQMGGVLDIIPADAINKNLNQLDKSVKEPSSGGGGGGGGDKTLRKRLHKQFDTENFKKSVRARLMVHQVVAGIRANTRLSFDFLVLLTLASMISAISFIEGSAVTIVSSMLLSPLMHPVMGIVFGLSVRESSLWHRGVRNEIVGLVLCVFWGFIMGLIISPAEPNLGDSNSFPTSEMKTRGNLKRIWIGVLKAVFSGAGVALSVLGGNTGSLVGAALSASLLPPAVNCGILWAYATFARRISHHAWGYLTNSSNISSDIEIFTFQPLLYPNKPAVNCTRPSTNNYSPYYSCDIAFEAAILGSCSFFLTVLNVICIIIVALIVLRIKEVVPLTQANEVVRGFFNQDMKLVRDYNRKSHPRVSIAELNTIDEDTSTNINELQTIAKDFQLNVFDANDRELLSIESKEKVQCLVKNLLDMYEEEPATVVDSCRYQPYGALTTAEKEHFIFYEHLIGLLPSKWHDLFVTERNRRLQIVHPAKQAYSFSKQSTPNEDHIRSRFHRSDPDVSHEQSQNI